MRRFITTCETYNTFVHFIFHPPNGGVFKFKKKKKAKTDVLFLLTHSTVYFLGTELYTDLGEMETNNNICRWHDLIHAANFFF
jgi:hypothetical protein